MPDDLVAYALDCATPDVASTLRWLDSQGFTQRGGEGGPGESFGNVLLNYDRDGMRVRVLRDRSQWFIELTPPSGQTYHPLAVLLTALSDDDPAPGTRDDHRTPLPDQLPPGISWADRVPLVIAWLARGDRSDDIARADARWRTAMKAFWNQ